MSAQSKESGDEASHVVTKLPMVCDCDDEGRLAAEALMAEVYRRLAAGTTELLPRDVNPENFLSQVSRSLWWDFEPGVSIEGIYCDQWFGVKAGGAQRTNQVFVTCDRVEHGLAAVWKYYADKGGVAVDQHGQTQSDLFG